MRCPARSGGERALYHALYPARHALHSSDEFARACGLPASPLDDLMAFHTVFGKTVPDIAERGGEPRLCRGAVAAPGLAGRHAVGESEVIGLARTRTAATGVVWVRTTGRNQRGEAVLEYVRWVMVRKRDAGPRARGRWCRSWRRWCRRSGW
jgi:2-methylfumaryl-CoA hydratase